MEQFIRGRGTAFTQIPQETNPTSNKRAALACFRAYNMLQGCRKIKPLQAKKLLVLAAYEVERHRKRTLDGANMTRQVFR